MNGEYLTLEQIHARYPNEWLVLDHAELDGTANPVGGVVVYHTPDEDEFNRHAPEVHTEDIPRFYSTIPPDPDEIFCARLLVGWFEEDDPPLPSPPPAQPAKRWWQFWR